MFAIDGPMADWEKELLDEFNRSNRCIVRNPIAGQQSRTSNSPVYMDAGLV